MHPIVGEYSRASFNENGAVAESCGRTTPRLKSYPQTLGIFSWSSAALCTRTAERTSAGREDAGEGCMGGKNARMILIDSTQTNDKYVGEVSSTLFRQLRKRLVGMA